MEWAGPVHGARQGKQSALLLPISGVVLGGFYLNPTGCARSNDSWFRKSTARPFDERARLGSRHCRSESLAPITMTKPSLAANAIGGDHVRLDVAAIFEAYRLTFEQE